MATKWMWIVLRVFKEVAARLNPELWYRVGVPPRLAGPRPLGVQGSGSFMLCSGFGRQSTRMAP